MKMTQLAGLEVAVKQIEFARQYTLTLINDMDDQEWFTMPSGCVTHLAWQVGHLAMAQYGLCLFRARGRRLEDGDLMSATFRKQFSKGTVPDADPTGYPSPREIRSTFDRVHAQAMSEIVSYDEVLLGEPVDMPYAGFPTKLGALFFCSHHEMLHAGQIGLLRRLLGKPPVR